MNPDPTSLDRLHEVIAPPPAPWWPPAPGWYWLLGALAVAAGYLLVRGVLRWQHNRYRREALAEWRRHNALLADPQKRGAAMIDLAILLKRAALTAFPRTRVASLTGPAWREFLDTSGSTRGFSSDAGVLLERAAYGGVAGTEIEQSRARESAALVHHWLREHRADAEGEAQP